MDNEYTYTIEDLLQKGGILPEPNLLANPLDGTYKDGAFSIKIRGYAYTSFYNGFPYGKGTILYDDDSFTLISTHARSNIFCWAPFVEVVK